MNTALRESSRRALRVFLSHAVVDREYARKLRSLLSRYPNLHIFTPDMLSAGEDWLSRLKDEVSQCDIFLVLLSPDSVNSEWILPEIGAAWALNKLIVPIVTQTGLSTEIPTVLQQSEFLEMKYLEDHPEAIDQILAKAAASDMT
jgi:hypothetical protein